MNSQEQLRMFNVNGQITVGKEFAGKPAMIDKSEPGMIIIKLGDFIPESQKWLYRDGNLEKIERALVRVRNTPFQDNFDEFVEKLGLQDV